MDSERMLGTSPPAVAGTLSDGPLVAISATRLVAASELDVNCRRAIDVVSARRGLKRTNTVQLEAGLVPDAGASAPVVQVWLVIVKSLAEPWAPVGSPVWLATVTPVMFSGASPRFSTL